MAKRGQVAEARLSPLLEPAEAGAEIIGGGGR